MDLDMEIEESLLDRAFDVGEDVSNYDPNDTPSNGHEYLIRVMMEAKNCPQVVVAKVNRQIFDAKQTFTIPKRETYSVPQSYIPSEEWQLNQIEYFLELKDEMALIRMYPEKLRRSVRQVPGEWSAPEKWFKYFYDPIDDKKYPEPYLSDMLRINQMSLSRVVSLFDEWFEESTVSFDKKTCLWLYSLLACLEVPLLPETCASLRSLACHAAKTRANIVNPDDEMLTRVNLIICLVGRYFKQIDLADKC